MLGFTSKQTFNCWSNTQPQLEVLSLYVRLTKLERRCNYDQKPNRVR